MRPLAHRLTSLGESRGRRRGSRRRRRPPFSPQLRLLAATLTAVCLAAACVGSRGGPPRLPEPGGLIERGVASWYGPGFHGRATASGEIYDMDGLTAAHKTLPLGTLVEVVNLDNGRRVTVRVNDRGPFVGRRILDLSRGAARALGMLGAGLATVELRLAAAPAERFTVQVGAFADRFRARALRDRLAERFADVMVLSEDGVHRVRVGRYERRVEADRTRRRLERLGFTPLVVTER